MDVNLILLKTDGSRKVFPLPTGATVIGRRSDCDLYARIRSVSKRHCQLNCGDGALKIRDLGSRNGTYLNGKRIDEAVIQAGDHIKIGPLTFVLQIDGQPEDITMPKPAGQKSSRKSTSAVHLGADDVEAFADLDDLDSFDDLDSLDDSGSLDDLDSVDDLDSL